MRVGGREEAVASVDEERSVRSRGAMAQRGGAGSGTARGTGGGIERRRWRGVGVAVGGENSKEEMASSLAREGAGRGVTGRHRYRRRGEEEGGLAAGVGSGDGVARSVERRKSSPPFLLATRCGKFQLGFFSPSSSINRYVGIWFHNISVQSVVWVANRDHPITSRAGRLSLTPNGTLVISDDESTIYWSSANLFTVGRSVAQLLDDANFVVR
ncbi:hypothetical protein ZIOFF_022548 [Zingiber officinale]|uniref:Bulb-type lectin domain-containing protein n=1 Tax=Zingiber officinale TaxID=94328 RepID=A0A8J5H9E9_ZINOF|nr:hypothetical protein ZIOFF_022548 [Zingiber officinale]